MPPPTTCPAIDIENKVIELILACEIEGITTVDVNLFARDMPERLDRDPSPCCIVVVGNDRLVKDKDAPKTNATHIYEYPVLVLLAKKIALTRSESDHWKKNARWILRGMLNRSFLLGKEGVVRRCHYEPEPDFMAAGYANDYKVSLQVFSYRCEEERYA